MSEIGSVGKPTLKPEEIESRIEEIAGDISNLRNELHSLKSRDWIEQINATIGAWSLIVTGTFFLWLFFFIMTSMSSWLQLVGLLGLSVLWLFLVTAAIRSFGRRR